MGSIEKVQNGVEVNLAQLEEDIITTVHAGRSLVSTALPDYVEPQQGVPRVGALSAEAVVRDYEAAAKEIESMGAELIDAAKKCEAMTAEVHNAIAYMRDTAAAYREEAKKIFKRIEDCALFTEDVRKTCEEVKRKMVEGTTSSVPPPTQD
ncbi:MAG TPA: hypothetical protein VHB49_02895 [Bradyrhizobium sp.]|nr:hypothetical protein [Bradyrhizobium sp.]